MNTQYLKRIMMEAGYIQNPSPGMEWSEPEEKGWRQVCAKFGLTYTPYPSRINQDPYWLDIIDREELSLQMPQPQAAPVFNVKDIMPPPTKFAEGTPTAFMRKHANVLDPDLPKEVAVRHSHAKRLPRKFVTTGVRDPMEGFAPTAPINRVKRTARRNSPEKAKLLNEVLSDDRPKRDPNKPIRVR